MTAISLDKQLITALISMRSHYFYNNKRYRGDKLQAIIKNNTASDATFEAITIVRKQAWYKGDASYYTGRTGRHPRHIKRVLHIRLVN